MSAYLEFHVKGGGCALVEAGSIAAVLAKGHDVWKVGSPDAPTLVVMRAGETIEVIGNSAGGVIGRVVDARAKAAKLKYEKGGDVYVDWMPALNQGEADAADGEPGRP